MANGAHIAQHACPGALVCGAAKLADHTFVQVVRQHAAGPTYAEMV